MPGGFKPRGGFKTVRLNSVGWATVIGAGLLTGLTLGIAGFPVQAAVPASLSGSWVMAVLADHRRWRRLEVDVGSSVLNEPDAAEAFLARLVRNGVRAEYVDTGENGKMGGRRRLRCRAPDAEAVIRELGDFLEDR